MKEIIFHTMENKEDVDAERGIVGKIKTTVDIKVVRLEEVAKIQYF